MVSEPVGDYFKPIISIDTFSTFLLVYSRFEGFKQTLKGVHLNDRELRSKNRTEGTWGNAKGLRNFATCALGKTCCALVRNRCFQTSLCSNFISLISLSTYSLVKNALRFFTVYVHTHTHTLLVSRLKNTRLKRVKIKQTKKSARRKESPPSRRIVRVLAYRRRCETPRVVDGRSPPIERTKDRFRFSLAFKFNQLSVFDDYIRHGDVAEFGVMTAICHA